MSSSNISRWGRWALDGHHLVYHVDAGESDPQYDLDISALGTRSAVRMRVDHLRNKGWIRPGDLRDLEQAGKDLMSARLAREEDMEAPPCMSGEEYRKHVEAKWSEFLVSADQSDERSFHAFFERYSTLLPGPHGTVGARNYLDGSHGPLVGGVISEPELPGIRIRRPDFLLFGQDSASLHVVLIEIEAPAKRWCTDNGVPAASLTQALDQVHEWKSWFAEPQNNIVFRELYGLNEIIRARRLVPHYVLIYGRRRDAERFDAFSKKRADLAGPNEYLMTYDRLVASTNDELTLKLDRSTPDTAFRVVEVPPTFKIEKSNALRFSRMKGREDAIRACGLITDERRQFLLERTRAADNYAHRTRFVQD
jgi:hypothetical protein